MRAYFKDNSKLIINSLDTQEAIIGQNFIKDILNKNIKIEERKDVNDDFDGLVITVEEKPAEEKIPYQTITSDVKFNIITTKDYTNLTFKVIDDDSVLLCDYDEEKVQTFLNFLKEYCTEDSQQTFSISEGFKFTTKPEVKEIVYVIPEGMITYYDRDNKQFITNNKLGINFTIDIPEETAPTEEVTE